MIICKVNTFVDLHLLKIEEIYCIDKTLSVIFYINVSYVDVYYELITVLSL